MIKDGADAGEKLVRRQWNLNQGMDDDDDVYYYICMDTTTSPSGDKRGGQPLRRGHQETHQDVQPNHNPMLHPDRQRRLNARTDATAEFLLLTDAFSSTDDKIDTQRKHNGARDFRHTPGSRLAHAEPPVPLAVFTIKDAQYPRDRCHRAVTRKHGHRWWSQAAHPHFIATWILVAILSLILFPNTAAAAPHNNLGRLGRLGDQLRPLQSVGVASHPKAPFHLQGNRIAKESKDGMCAVSTRKAKPGTFLTSFNCSALRSARSALCVQRALCALRSARSEPCTV